MPDLTPLEYEVTVYDHQVAYSVLDKIRLTRYGATCIFKEFSKLPYDEVSQRMSSLSNRAWGSVLFEGHPDDDNPYTITIVKLAPETCSVCGRVKDSHHI